MGGRYKINYKLACIHTHAYDGQGFTEEEESNGGGLNLFGVHCALYVYTYICSERYNSYVCKYIYNLGSWELGQLNRKKCFTFP